MQEKEKSAAEILENIAFEALAEKAIRYGREDFPILTEGILFMRSKPEYFYFGDEFRMIFQLVSGMNAQEFHHLHNIEKGKSLKPFLSPEQLALSEKLQIADVGLMVAVPDREMRRRHLEWYKSKISLEK